MFGNKAYKEVKAKKFASDNERKRYFAIKKYYEKKSKEPIVVKLNKEKTKKWKNIFKKSKLSRKNTWHLFYLWYNTYVF